MKKVILKGRKVHGGSLEGEAIVTKGGFAGFGSFDIYTGRVVERGHDWEGKDISGKILVFKTGKGSSAWSIGAQASRFTGKNPKALIVKESNPQVALGSVVMRIPAMTDLTDTLIDEAVISLLDCVTELSYLTDLLLEQLLNKQNDR